MQQRQQQQSQSPPVLISRISIGTTPTISYGKGVAASKNTTITPIKLNTDNSTTEQQGNSRFIRSQRKSSMFGSGSGRNSLSLGRDSPHEAPMKVCINTPNPSVPTSPSIEPNFSSLMARRVIVPIPTATLGQYQQKENARKLVMVKRRIGLSPPITTAAQRAPHQLHINLVSEQPRDLSVTSATPLKQQPRNLYSTITASTINRSGFGRSTTVVNAPSMPSSRHQWQGNDAASSNTRRVETSNLDLGSIPTSSHLMTPLRNRRDKPVTVSQLVRLMNNDAHFSDVHNNLDPNEKSGGRIWNKVNYCQGETTSTEQSLDVIGLQSVITPLQDGPTILNSEVVSMSIFDKNLLEQSRGSKNATTRVSRNLQQVLTTTSGTRETSTIGRHPLIGPNGTFDLHSVLNANIQKNHRQAAMTSTSSFGLRSPSLPTPQQVPSLALTSQMASFELQHQGSRSISTARSIRTPKNLQEFLPSKNLNNDLIKKIRIGVSLDLSKKQSDLGARKQAYLRSRQTTEETNVEAFSVQSEVSKVMTPRDPGADSMTSSAMSRKIRREKLEKPIEYCPDEDSDNDIIATLQNLPPGMRPPIPKPNDPQQLHTWRQISKVKDNYISRLESRLSPTKPDNNRHDHVPLRSSTDFEQRPTDHSKMPPADLSRKLSTQKKSQQQKQGQDLPLRPFRPKMSVDFCKWIEKEQIQDPKLVQHIATVLKPEKQRETSEQKNVDYMAILVKNQGVLPKMKKLAQSPMWQKLITAGFIESKQSPSAESKTRNKMLHPTQARESHGDLKQSSPTIGGKLNSNNKYVNIKDQQKRRKNTPDDNSNRIALHLNQQKLMSHSPKSGVSTPRQPSTPTGPTHSKISPINKAAKSQWWQSKPKPKTPEVDLFEKSDVISANKGLPITVNEVKYTKKMFSQNSLVSHFRRLKVFNSVQAELQTMRDKKVEKWSSSQNAARATLRKLLAVYWKQKWFRRRRLAGNTNEENFKQSEAEAKEAVLTRVSNMTQYVGKLEDLIHMNPIARNKLVEESVYEIKTSLHPRDTDETTYSVMRELIMRKLDEATCDIQIEHEEKMQKLQGILDQYGSVEAYKEHLDELRSKHAGEMASALLREQEMMANQEAERKQQNAKNSLENQLKVARWLGNYEEKTIEIMQEEIDVLAEMQEEETLAALCLIQDDAMEEHHSYLYAKDELNSLIMNINQEVKDIKKTLKSKSNAKSGKLDKSELTSSKNEKFVIGSLDSQGDESDDSVDYDRDSHESNSSDDKKSKRSARRQKQKEAKHRRSQHFLAGHRDTDSDSDESSEVAEVTAGRRTSKSRRTDGTKKTDEDRVPTGDRSKSRGSQMQTPDGTADYDEEDERIAKIKADKEAIIKKRKKKHKKKLKALKKELRQNMVEMENRLYELQDKVEEDGIDALLANYDPTAKKPKQQAFSGQEFNQQQQLTAKLDNFLDKSKPGVHWDDEEKDQVDSQVREKNQIERRPSMVSKMTGGTTSVRSILNRKKKPMAIEVFEKVCLEMNERCPQIFKKCKNGNFELKEITLTQGQTVALSRAAEHFENFADKVRLQNNNMMDPDLCEVVTALQEVKGLKKLAIARNNIGVRTLVALERLLAKKFPNNLDELSFEGIQLKPQLVKGLMNTLTASNLRKLSLSELNMNEDSFNQFIAYVKKCQLEELDIRDSKVTANQFLVMLDVLKNNKQLRFLNLSHNNLVAQKPSSINYGNMGGLETIAEEGGGGGGLNQPRDKKGLNEEQAELIDCIAKFICRNKQLIHLNLEDTGLNYPMIRELLQAIKRSRSLQAIHLCGNPGLSEIEIIHDTVKCLNPINFSEWDDYAVASNIKQKGNTKKQVRQKSTLRNPSMNQLQPMQSPSRRNLQTQNQVNQGSQRNLRSAMANREPDVSEKTSRQSQLQFKTFQQVVAETPIAGSSNPTSGGILKASKPSTFEAAAAAHSTTPNNLDIDSDSDSDSKDSKRKSEGNMFQQLHAGLNTRQHRQSKLQLEEQQQQSLTRTYSKQSNRLQVYHQERTGKKSVSFQIMKDSVQLMNYKKFILTRFVGHKQTMEHGHRWRLYLEANQNANCWICEKWNYTLFFWSRRFGENDHIKMTSQQLTDFNEKSRCVELFTPGQMPIRGAKKKTSTNLNRGQAPTIASPRENQTQQRPSLPQPYRHEHPLLTGSHNGWEEPQRMLRVREFAHFIDRKKPELYQLLRNKQLIGKAAQKYQEMTPDERKIYQEHLPKFKLSYEPEFWKEKMARLLKYRRANLVNLFDMDIQVNHEVFVTAAFVKPGTHTYMISDLRNTKEKHQNLHECQVDQRVEPIQPYERITKIKSGDVFQRWKTIFAQWPTENDQMFRQCVEHDFKFWKATRLVKDPEDYDELCAVILKNAKLLVQLFTFLAAKSQYPAIGLIDFGIFCQDCRIIDPKLLSNQVDLQFKAATSANPNIIPDEKMKKMRAISTKSELLKLQPDSALIRYQFLEILVRISGAKYKGSTYTGFKQPPEKIHTYARALEVLINDNILQQFDFDTPESVRFNRLWKNDVAAIFRANQNLIQELISKVQKKKKYLSFEATYSLIEKVQKPEQTAQTGISLKEFTQIYGMSKMLVVEESNQGLKYLRTQFLEIVELIARLTIFKNFNTQMEDLPFYKQLQLTMDELFEYHLGFLSFDIGAGDSEESSGESEDDY